MERWELDKEQRMQLKAWICILGAILLAVLLLGRGLLLFWGWWSEMQYEPVIRQIFNVWIMEVTDTGVLVFEEGVERFYVLAEGAVATPQMREQVADITLADECVTQIVCKTEKINGKVLAADAFGVEVEG